VVSCSRRTYPKVGEVEKITVSIDSSKGLNFGTVMPINFTAHTQRKGTLNVNQFITFQNPNTYFYKNGLHINVDPTGYSDSFIQVKYKYLDALYWDSFKMELTYDEDICINASGKSAVEEEEKQTFIGNLLNIAAGSDGNDGKKGKNAHNVKAYIWKDSISEIYSIYVKDEQAKTVKYYVTNELVNLFIDASGGNGSNGEDGKRGRAGKSGGRDTPGTIGESGGDGGNAGDGGNGGDVIVYIHTNAKEFKESVKIVNYGGSAGVSGKGASGGPGGTGNPPGSNGYDGYDGMTGFKGYDGYMNEIKMEDFIVDDIL
jgi:hypothetical protein